LNQASRILALKFDDGSEYDLRVFSSAADVKAAHDRGEQKGKKPEA